MKRILLSVLCLSVLFVGAACSSIELNSSGLSDSETFSSSVHSVDSEDSADSSDSSGSEDSEETPLPDPGGENELPLVPVN